MPVCMRCSAWISRFVSTTLTCKVALRKRTKTHKKWLGPKNILLTILGTVHARNYHERCMSRYSVRDTSMHAGYQLQAEASFWTSCIGMSCTEYAVHRTFSTTRGFRVRVAKFVSNHVREILSPNGCVPFRVGAVERRCSPHALPC